LTKTQKAYRFIYILQPIVEVMKQHWQFIKEKHMKRKLLAGLAVLAMVFGFTGCPSEDDDNENDKNKIPAAYKDFYNYPTGRVDSNGGRLTVNNAIASEVLLFDGTVEAGNYLGTISSLGSVRLRLPDEKFYTIVAVQKATYEERRSQAAQFNSLTYYSNTQPYTSTVSPSNTYGGGNWVFNNNTNYWVEVKKADLSQNYAVIPPNAQRVTIPIAMGEAYDYYLYFKRELKYDGKVIALVDFTDRSQANTATANNNNPTFTTTISNASAPSSNIRPAVMVINNAPQTVRIYYSNTQKTNGAGGDFVIAGGQRALVSGFEAGDSTGSINFNALAWEQNRQVPASQNISMLADKVYEITIPNNGEASGIVVVEVNSSKYYN
jgi:hypothetical protein